MSLIINRIYHQNNRETKFITTSDTVFNAVSGVLSEELGTIQSGRYQNGRMYVTSLIDRDELQSIIEETRRRTADAGHLQIIVGLEAYEMPDTEQLDLIRHEFMGVIREWLTPEELLEVARENNEDQDHDALHAYCDPNEVVLDAYESVMGIPLDMDNIHLFNHIQNHCRIV